MLKHRGDLSLVAAGKMRRNTILNGAAVGLCAAAHVLCDVNHFNFVCFCSIIGHAVGVVSALPRCTGLF